MTAGKEEYLIYGVYSVEKCRNKCKLKMEKC
jgi:hypothetical protein